MRWLGWLAAIAIGVYAAIHLAFPTYTHKFRLTFQVESDGVVKEGSSVITVTDTDQSIVGSLAPRRWIRSSKGPVPWVDLGNRGLLLVSMNNYNVPKPPQTYYVGGLSFVAFYDAKPGDEKLDEAHIKAIREEKGRRYVPVDRLPTFIWLSDPLDPNSAKIVPPTSFADEIGGGTRLISMTVEITNDIADRSIYDRLPWLAEMERKQRSDPSMKWSTSFRLNIDHILGAQ